MSDEKYREIADKFMDWCCKRYSSKDCIIWLCTHTNVNKDDLYEMGFESIDIEPVYEEYGN